MKSGFNDPIAIKKQDPKDSPVNGKNSPFDFSCPQYDQRSSCFVNAGTKYGVGYKTPVGKLNDDGKSPIPFGKIKTMKVDET